MDFIGPRAVPALIALALGPATALADCDGLAGRYQYFSGGKERAALSTYVDGAGKKKLFKNLGPSTPAADLGSTAPRARLKFEHLAATVTFQPRADGAELEFFDPSGASLARLGLQPGYRCNGDRLERAEERLSGLGDQIQEIRVEESFARGTDGALVYRVRQSAVEGKAKTIDAEARFAPAR